MKNTWYISAFILALAFVGISLDRVAVPNQEIVIQFSDNNTTLDRTQEAIALVKNQLSTIDAGSIKIEQLVNGTLKVSYYSELEVAEIKTLFSKALEIGISDTQPNFKENGDRLPLENGGEQYQLDIYKIQESSDFDGAVGTILESKSETTRSSKTKFYASGNRLPVQEQHTIQKVAFTAHKNHAIAINNSSYKIPETRAGPIS